MKVLTLGLQTFVSCFGRSKLLTTALLLTAIASSLQAADKFANPKSSQADESVREALQREVYGLDQDRDRLLSAALSADPENTSARWQAGYVSSNGRWVKAGENAAPQRQALLAKYQELRLARRDTVDEQLGLADWCATHRLKDQERAHLLRVCQLSPDHAAARQRLGFVHVGTEWLSLEDQARQAEAKVDLEKWTATFESLFANMSSPQPKYRRMALEQIKLIRDPAAIAALWSVVADRGEEMELTAVEITSQITDPEAAVALAQHAILSKFARVRKLASSKLANYDQEAYVPTLVAALYTPVTTQYNAVRQGKQINYHHQLVREGLTRREMLVFDTGYRNFSSNGNQGFAKAMALGDAAENAKRLEAEAAKQNETTKVNNERIAHILREATGTQLGAEPEAWWKWWTEHSEVFVEGQKPTATVHHMVSINVADRGLRTVASNRQESLSNPIQPRYDCLAAGTPVWTEMGQVAVEQVRVGDLVLSRDVESGELALKPVVRTTIRPAGQLTKVRAGNETFETSGGHLFWVSGEGWVKSRQLESGMVLHTAAGPVRVSEVVNGRHAETYNLVVADFNTYFVGSQKVMSHDNTVRRPTNRVVPGLVAE
jgi:hypothetical protein